MTAIRLGMWEQAFDLLLMDTKKNNYLPNGHVYQGRTLPVYLPANGGLLSAVAALCAGFYSGPLCPQNKGQWSLNWDGLNPLL